jgi:hypothetical protein
MEKKIKSGPRLATTEEMRDDALRQPAPTYEEMVAQMKRLEILRAKHTAEPKPTKR